MWYWKPRRLRVWMATESDSAVNHSILTFCSPPPWGGRRIQPARLSRYGTCTRVMRPGPSSLMKISPVRGSTTIPTGDTNWFAMTRPTGES